MTWYAAHIIMFAEFIDGIQDRYIILENVVLIEAQSDTAAFVEAERLALDNYSSGEIVRDGRSAIWKFGGIRKLIECQYVASKEIELKRDSFQPESGAEITYSWLEVKSAAAFAKLINGEPVRVLYEE